nr:hypothetical protein [Tanacetum cinerariifolium]
KDEEYVMAVRDFKKFFKRRDKDQKAFIGGSWSDIGEEDDEKAKDETRLVAQASNEDKKESSDGECLTFGSKDEEYVMAVRDFKKFFKRRDKDQKAFVGGSWSDIGEEDDEKAKDETRLVAQA